MPINFACECGKPFWTAEANAGRRMLCTRCGRELDVPLPREEIVFIDPPPNGWLARTDRVFNVRVSARALTYSVIGLVLLGLCFAFNFPYLIRSGTHEAARRSQCINNLKQIGLALHNYHTEYGHFPGDITDPRGKPLLSWRVRILPYMDLADLHAQFKLDEPWNSANNWPLIAKMPSAFTCPSNRRPSDGKTEYQAVVGPGSMGDGVKPTSIEDVTDGVSDTLQVVEVNKAPVPWTKPDDVDIRSIGAELGSEHTGGLNVLRADGSVQFLKKTVSPEVLRALATKAGGEKVDDHP